MNLTRQFICCFTACSLILVFTFQSLAADIPISKSDSSVPAGQSKSPFRIPVAVSYNTDELNVHYIYSVGVATITVTDEFGSVVYQEITDTTAQTTISIPIELWDSGSYVISIKYGSISLKGSFNL
jgi:hypothetical protein